MKNEKNLKIFSRENEIEIFQNIIKSNQSELIALYGRRRIGKTYLVYEFFKNYKFFFYQTGIKNGSSKEQLENFNTIYSDMFFDGEKQITPENWQQAFDKLRKQLEKVRSTKQKIVIFFDELPWLASPRSGFIKHLEYLWNQYLSKNPNIIMILCGSAASWMIKKIVKNKGGLHGRLTRKIHLEPFTLIETEAYLKSKKVKLCRKDIIELYMAFGGVAKYLDYVLPNMSVAQIIDKTCFSHNGELRDEFDNLYKSLFDNSDNHMKIIKALAKKRVGLTRNEVAKLISKESGGRLSAVLEELEQSGFIKYIPFFGKDKKTGQYRLIDEFSLFSLHWISRSSDLDLGDNYWLKKSASNSWKSWSGYSYEGICLKHIKHIKKGLQIGAVETSTSCWYGNRKSNKIQIDLVIDRKDNVINLCEIKYYKDAFKVGNKEIKNLLEKEKVFREETKTKKTTFTTLITTYGANETTKPEVDMIITTLDLNVLF